MQRRDVARLHRLLRTQAGLTQSELAVTADIGRWKVSALETGRWDHLKIAELDRCFSALDARIVLSVAHRGGEADRLLDRHHASLVAATVRVLTELDWEVRVEVTFNEFGDRGSIDIVAWHPAHRALLVVEVKSELVSIEGTLRPFSVKCRLAAKVVGEQFGWRPVIVGKVLVLPELSTARRAVERNASVLDTALPDRSRAARQWLRQPTKSLAAIWFLSDVGLVATKRSPSAVKRVRRSGSRSR